MSIGQHGLKDVHLLVYNKVEDGLPSLDGTYLCFFEIPENLRPFTPSRHGWDLFDFADGEFRYNTPGWEKIRVKVVLWAEVPYPESLA